METLSACPVMSRHVHHGSAGTRLKLNPGSVTGQCLRHWPVTEPGLSHPPLSNPCWTAGKKARTIKRSLNYWSCYLLGAALSYINHFGDCLPDPCACDVVMLFRCRSSACTAGSSPRQLSVALYKSLQYGPGSLGTSAGFPTISVQPEGDVDPLM